MWEKKIIRPVDKSTERIDFDSAAFGVTLCLNYNCRLHAMSRCVCLCSNDWWHLSHKTRIHRFIRAWFSKRIPIWVKCNGSARIFAETALTHAHIFYRLPTNAHSPCIKWHSAYCEKYIWQMTLGMWRNVSSKCAEKTHCTIPLRSLYTITTAFLHAFNFIIIKHFTVSPVTIFVENISSPILFSCWTI